MTTTRKGYVPPNLTRSQDQEDPLALYNYGYRSAQHRKPIVFDEDLGDPGEDHVRVMYNNFWFPPTAKTRCTIVPEYDSNGRSVKYITIALTVEAIITPEVYIDPSASNPNTDKTMEDLRKRLIEPGQVLHIQGHGLGKLIINDETQKGETLYDLDYGPKTQVVDWEPIAGGLASRVEWLTTTRIPRCDPVNASNDPGSEYLWFLDPLKGEGFIDFSWEASWSYNELGFMTKTIKGNVELALTREPNDDGESADTNINLDRVMNKFQQAQDKINLLFPEWEGFRRTREFSISKDKKKLSFTIVDTEIPSPIGLPTGPVQFDLTESLTASIKEAFNVWKWRLSGSITVPYTKVGTDMINNKRLAYDAFFLVFEDRISRASGKVFNHFREAGLANALGDFPAELLEKDVQFIPQKIHMSNDIFGVGINVDIEYKIIAPSPIILAATGMMDAFQAVYGPSFSWSAYKEFLSGGVVIPSSVTGNILPDVDWVVDFCHPFPFGEQAGLAKDDPDQQEVTFSASCPDAASSWVTYQNEFEVVNDYNTMAVSYLAETAEPKDTLSGSEEAYQTGNLAINSHSTITNTDTYNEVSTSGEPTTYIVMRGSAVRMDYPINPPRLTGVKKFGNTIDAIHVGQDRISQSSMPMNLVKTVGGTTGGCNMYYCSWERTYVVKGVVGEFVPATSGQPSNYYGRAIT